ncbi:probable serine/threonine-protein kinase SIS8 [Neltuma alba]|uniref:probable serine/threonine-protein kinase SIS8 n=1 Tax=Neltuma alba TaxID=207710 RepID=UPI0010A44FC2|nr:probable serine/threonine-protein kinase SIS8 [Prosopis alba]
MPLLIDLQTTSVSENLEREVILVNRMVDNELKQLEKKAYKLLKNFHFSEQGLILSGLLQKLADIVVNRMGGPVGDADEILKRWTMRSRELRNSLRTSVLPIGCLDVGLSRHRALLFKVLSDRINVPCLLVKGSYYTGTDDGAVNLIKADDGSEFIIDLMGAPGALIPAEIPSSQLQNYSFPVRSCTDIVEVSKDAHLMLDDGSRMLAVSGRCSAVGTAWPEELINVGSKKIPVERNSVGMNQAERSEHKFGNHLQSLHKSGESSSGAKASPAGKKQAKDVSTGPDFAQNLHIVQLENYALPSSDLFSHINTQNTAQDKVFEDFPQVTEKIVKNSVQADPDKLLSSCEKSVKSPQGVCSTSDNARKVPDTFCNGIEELEQLEALDIESASSNAHQKHEEQFLESSLPRAAVSCKRQRGVNFVCDDDENLLNNKAVEAFNDTELDKASAVQLNETANGDHTKYDGKSDKVNAVLGEGVEWEIQWEDLQIGERIGIGSYGEVYHADLKGTEVAVKKFLDQDFSGDALAQFKSEVEIMLRLRHPNVVLFMGAITRPPHSSILTEFLPRGSLYRLLHRPNFRLEEKRRLRMAFDVAKGMNYLHTSHPPIVHRDLKSPNLLVDKHWVVKVCDFGLSRLKHHTFLSSKSTAGTPEWMAPEVLRNEPANEKCDVYSFGVILWELATTRIPWKGLNPMQVVGAVGFQNRRLEIPEDVDPVVAQIICDCWQTEPHLRPSFSQIMSRLRHLRRLVVRTDSTEKPNEVGHSTKLLR